MSESIMQRVRQQVLAYPPGELLTYADLVTEPAQFGAVAAALSRLSREGLLARYAKGQYYRPQTGRFGTLKPSEGAVMRTLTAPAGKVAAYPTGVALYNQLGLTTQVPAQLQVTTPKPRRTRSPRMGFVVRPAPEQASDVPLLQWLEVLRDLRRIPDARPDEVLSRVQRFIKGLSPARRSRLVELALGQAPPRARAVLGAVLEQQADQKGAARLRATLNPLTTYRLGLSAAALPNCAAWNIR
ncbi:hypothetical protein J7E24_15820 [Hymenobacter sp. ISL-91]|uniref:AbiEi antitoxin C-terminal domain-containing protein n=2 Tax=Hymenobacter TaxID=89966 RepID=A0A328BC01_9BACT|nr:MULTISPECIES: DUF6088 family protein [Hymenobacter]MBD2717256.1 hypothetical protein [Hymenobacter duratus]MBR7952176.1 hypothetical protein [Microvirga sp. STR05]MBT2559256.1 hypothetical protein [Hymenobacter sp. ISL-91]RAK62608.1 hypothetical protein DLM85_23250 [Hymenobacter edaphi]